MVTNRGYVEINEQNLAHNFSLLMQEKASDLAVCAVVKDNALGHGMILTAKKALQAGCVYLAVACMEEAIELRKALPQAAILLFGERTKEELSFCIENNITLQIQSLAIANELALLAKKVEKQAKVHIKIDTGMGRYGLLWQNALETIEKIYAIPSLEVEGIMTHFAQSDELDKTYATQQWNRFESIINKLKQKPKYIHTCNSGGYLDLPFAHGSMVRIGILTTGVYPSDVCRHINFNNQTLLPVMSVRTKISFIKQLEKGDYVGYGMHFQAKAPCKIAVLPIGYGDGYPRLRNVGEVLVCNQKAPIRGGNAMDATMIDITHIPQAKLNDPVTLVGEQGDLAITVRQLAKWANTVPYQIMSSLNSRKLTFKTT